MGLFLDFFVILIIIINVFLGYKKGLINVVFSICAFFIAIFISLFLFNPVSNYIINNTELDEKIMETIISKNENMDDIKQNEEGIKGYIEGKLQTVIDDTKEATLEVIGRNVSIRIVKIVTMLALFVVTRVILIFLKFVFEGISEIPVIKQFNSVGGIIYGCLKALIIIFIGITIMYFIICINNDGIISQMLSESYITRFLYENNILLSIAF